MRYLEKGKISLILNNPQAISALRATGNSPANLLWLLHSVLWADLQHLDSFSISLAGHYGATLGEQLCVMLFPWSHPLLWPSLSRAGWSAESLSRTGEGMGRGAATCWGCCLFTLLQHMVMHPLYTVQVSSKVWGAETLAGWSSLGSRMYLPRVRVQSSCLKSSSLPFCVCQHHGCDFRHLRSSLLHVLFPSICSSALAEGITLCLRSAHCLENVIWGGVWGFISAKSAVQSKPSFVHGFRAAVIVWCFLFGDLQKSGPVSHSGHHLSCPASSPHPAQGGSPRSDPSQCDRACRLLDRFATIQQHLACCCHFHCPHFLCCLKNNLTASLPNWGETSSIRTFLSAVQFCKSQ